MSPSGPQLRRAAALGTASGPRTFGAWGGPALRGRVSGRTRLVLSVAAGGEMVFDKLPGVPPRCEPPALAGRIIAGALAGRLAAGTRGAGVGAATAAAATYASERARALVGAHTGLPDPALGLIEDALVLGIAAAAAGSPPDEVEDADEPTLTPEHAAVEPPPRSPVGAIARGLLAASVGTAAMTSVQVAYLRATGGEPSSAPGEVGRKLLSEVADQKVPRGRRAAFNQAMHVLYGTAWGAPFGLLNRAPGARTPSPLGGLGLGVAVWGVSLVQLPLLGIAPPPWRQPISALLPDLAFHLVYGTATAAVHGALTA
jgi:uncharacterized membrane protein